MQSRVELNHLIQHQREGSVGNNRLNATGRERDVLLPGP